MTSKLTVPQPTLTVVDAIALIVGLVIGAGIFETPALVAANASSQGAVMLAWTLGGVMSFVGGLCFGELATTYPDPGGNYYYLLRTFGRPLAFLFAWARMTVIQTGSIALLAFVFGDYATQLLPLGPVSTAIYAALAIALLTGMNLIGISQSKWTQNGLTAAKILGLLLIVLMGLLVTPAATSAPVATPTTGSTWGLMLIFVLLTYGGWNEAAYISAELRQVQRNMVKVLLWSISIITGIYLLINLAYFQGLGLAGMAASQAVAADLTRQALGEPGARFISALIAISTLGAINATIFTGARTNYALGRDFPLFARLGQWHQRANTPTQALLAQGAIALALVLLGVLTRKGFETMVEYTAPVFWAFFLLTGVSLLLLRWREPEVYRPFRVPLYPLLPLLFCAICGYLLYASLAYTGIGALVGVAAVAIGVPVWFWNQHQSRLLH